MAIRWATGTSWDAFARNAVGGEWDKNGENTFARRRGGITPEIPVRSMEGPPNRRD